ncbi:unnamed protein product [Allacma fusca]|uniref:Amino acid transporter transmembrane domain-containing protein n=1 Tax=Allacma fusca TaxID=39272 RepID=A0A8J2JEU6_9HEXA|nr:unnamed protein product [Allacma fusca]
MVTTQVMTMANCIVGVSVLAMPFCFKQCGVVLASILLMLSGVMTRTICYFLLKASTITRRRTYELLAYHTFGQAGKLVVEISIIGFLFGTLIAFLVVMGDLGPEIMSDVFAIENNTSLRTIIMTALSLFVALPLGLLRNIDSLSGVSTVTMLFYLILVGKIFTEGMGPLWSGSFLTRIHYWRPAGVLQCIPIFSMALSCQTQIFGIYDSLPEPSLQKMNEVVKKAINMCTAFYISVGFFGYIAFCTQNFGGNILLSFRPTGSTQLIKLCFILSIAFSFPLVILPCRASLHSLIFKRVHLHHHVHDITTNYIPESRLKLLTVGIIGFTLFIGLMIPNIELVLGLVGSTTGSVICIIFPSVMFIRVTSKHTTERLLAQTVFFIGVVIMVVTTYVTLYAVEQAQVNDMSISDTNPITEAIRKVAANDRLTGKNELIKGIENIVPERSGDRDSFSKLDTKLNLPEKSEGNRELPMPGEVIFKKNASKMNIAEETKAKFQNLDKVKQDNNNQPVLNPPIKPNSMEVLSDKDNTLKEQNVVPKVQENSVVKDAAPPVKTLDTKSVNKVAEVSVVGNPISDVHQNLQVNNQIGQQNQAIISQKNFSSSKQPILLNAEKASSARSIVSTRKVPLKNVPEKLNQEDFLLQQLKEHEKEQKKLLEEQKEILAKLKQHQAEDELKEQLKEDKLDRKAPDDPPPPHISGEKLIAANEENLKPLKQEKVQENVLPAAESNDKKFEPQMNQAHSANEKSVNANHVQPIKDLQNRDDNPRDIESRKEKKTANDVPVVPAMSFNNKESQSRQVRPESENPKKRPEAEETKKNVVIQENKKSTPAEKVKPPVKADRDI